MIPFAVILFFGAVVGGTGPAYQEWRARREARLEHPDARVTYLPSEGCRK